MRNIHAAVLCALAAVLLSPLQAQTVDPAITSDPPTDTAHPAAMQSVQVPSHGALLNGLVYIAAGTTPHPVVVLLHGFPGNEKNLDLAQAIRRAGWDVLYFDYRGSWGTPGIFSFLHAMEDTQAAVAWVRDPSTAKKLNADSREIVLIGHSMGGLIAAYVGAQDPKIRAVGLISAADMAGQMAKIPPGVTPAQAEQKLATSLAAEGMAPLAGCTPQGLAHELMTHTQEWSLPHFASGLASRPVLVVTSDDGGAAASDALVSALQQAGDSQVQSVHLATDHAYSDKRIQLEQTVLDGLQYLKQQ